MKTKISVLIADDQRLFSEGLQVVLEARAPELKVVAIAENGREACALADQHRPDIVLLDVRMPGMDGVDATRIIHERHPEIKVLILTTFPDDEYVTESIKNGAVGYLLKNRRPQELIDSIRALHKGILQIDSAVSKRFLALPQDDGLDAEKVLDSLRTLTGRERDILRRLAAAKRIAQISQELGIAEQTVRNHISNIYSKLNMHNRVEIVRYMSQIRYYLEHTGD